jgi:tetratricopeptide (TPR) repeat protein
VENFSKAIEMKPDSYGGLSRRANVAFGVKNYKAADSGLYQGNDTDPEILEAYVKRAECNEQLQKFEDALNDYSKVIAMIPIWINGLCQPAGRC